MSTLKEVLRKKIDEHRPRTTRLVKECGDVKLGDVTIAQTIGGARGIKSLVTDISYLDPFEGIRFRGMTIPETFEALPKFPGSEYPYVEGFWYLLLTPPAGLSEAQLFLWLTGFAVLVRAAMTLYHVPHMAMGAELSNDYHERTSVVAWRMGCSVAGAGLIFGVGVRVLFPESAWSRYGCAAGKSGESGSVSESVSGSASGSGSSEPFRSARRWRFSSRLRCFASSFCRFSKP